MDENLAANADVVNVATPEVPASTETTETTTEPTTQTVAPDVTQTQEFSRRAAEMRDKAVAEVAEMYGLPVKKYDDVKQAKISRLMGGTSPSSLPNAPAVDLTPEEKTSLQAEYNDLCQQLIADGTPETAAKLLAQNQVGAKENSLRSAKQQHEAQIQQKQQGQLDQIIRENPDYFKDGKISMPDEVRDALVDIMASGQADNIYSAHKVYLSDKAVKNSQKKIDELTATVAALTGNKTNAEATTGSVGSGPTDPFIISEESISNMKPEEMKSHWAEIKKFYKMK
jgi:hypothetical protein